MNIESFQPRLPRASRRAGMLSTMLATLTLLVIASTKAHAAPPPAPPPSSSQKISSVLLHSPKLLIPRSSGQQPVMKKSTYHKAATIQNNALKHVQLKPDLVSPAELGVVHDTKICTMRAGASPKGPSCAALNDGSKVAMLSWIWAPCNRSNCVKHISGYKIYHPGTPIYTTLIGHGGGHRTALMMNGKLVATVSPSQMAYGLATFKPGDCFVVRAYTVAMNGQPAQESANSDQLCLKRGMRVGTRKVELSSPRWKQSSYGVANKADKAASCAIPQTLADPAGLIPALHNLTPVVVHGGVIPDVIVGNREIYVHRTFGCDTNAAVFLRSGVYFDLSQIANQPVSRATLSFDLAQGQWSGDASTPTAVPISCATQVGRATADWEHGWTANSGAIPGAGFVALPWGKQRVSEPLQVDVTSIVQDWATGTPDHGFVLSMNPKVDETHHAQNSTCLSKYNHFKLTAIVPRTL